MQRLTLTVFSALMTSTALVQAQDLFQTIRTPDKAVPAVNQTLSGAWLQELRTVGLAATQPGLLNIITFQPDGTSISSAADGSRSPAHGLWVRVGDRKFLQTTFLFNFNESRVLSTVTKVRVNVQLSPDGQTMSATAEVVVMDRDGKVMATIPGNTYRGVRLSLETPDDFYDFQKLP